jgi:hypothetical protein
MDTNVIHSRDVALFAFLFHGEQRSKDLRNVIVVISMNLSKFTPPLSNSHEDVSFVNNTDNLTPEELPCLELSSVFNRLLLDANKNRDTGASNQHVASSHVKQQQ